MEDVLCLDVDSIDSAIHYLVSRQARLDESLSEMRSHALAHDATRLPSILSQAHWLSETNEQICALQARLQASCEGSEKVSARVRGLHTARGRVNEVLSCVERLSALEECAEAIGKATAEGDFQLAVRQVLPLLGPAPTEATRGLEHASESAADGSISERRKQIMSSLESRLQREIDAAAAAHNEARHSQLSRLMAQLLEPLGRGNEATSRHISFCCEQLQAIADTVLSEGGKGDRGAATSALAQLLQRAASYVEAATEQTQQAAAESERRIARELRDLCVRLGGKIAARYNSVAAVRSQAEAASRLMLAANQAVAGTTHLPELTAEIESAATRCESQFTELSAMLRGVTQWDGYMGARCGESTREGSLRKMASISEMARCAVSLLSFLTWAGVVKALSLHPAEGGETGALVDSVFFVLQQALRRASHCCDAGIGASAIKLGSELLSKHLLEQLRSQIRQSLSSKLAGAALASAQAVAAESIAMAERAGLAVNTSIAPRLAGLLRTLSALHMCLEYTPRLWERAEADFAKSLPQQAMEGVRAAVGVAGGALAGFEAAFGDGIKQLSATLQPKLRSRLEAFGGASFVLESEAGYNAARAEGYFGGLVTELEATLASLKPELVEGAREALLQALITASAERVEATLLQKKFDQLGALHLDSELRALTKRIAEMSTKPVRLRMARLAQMSALLNVDREEEAEEIWADGSWQLSPAEAKTVLGLRIDFRKEKIAALSLPELGSS